MSCFAMMMNLKEGELHIFCILLMKTGPLQMEGTWICILLMRENNQTG